MDWLLNRTIMFTLLLELYTLNFLSIELIKRKLSTKSNLMIFESNHIDLRFVEEHRLSDNGESICNCCLVHCNADASTADNIDHQE
jgi:hypothetical protein